MPEPLRVTFARWCRSTRSDLDITQQELADAVGVSRSLIAAFESGRRVPDLDVVERIGATLGVDIKLACPRPGAIGPREHDLVHARCSGYAARRLVAHGLEPAREVEVVDGRYRGWIDVVAFDRRTGHLLVIEIKTTIDDVGAIERQIGWYERLAATVAGDHGWRPRKVSSWLLVLASEQVDQALARERDVFDAASPVRSGALRAMLADGVGPGRGLAMIDPARRRSDWLLPTRLDGRRTAAPYADSAAALRKLGLSPIVPMSRPVTRAG